MYRNLTSDASGGTKPSPSLEGDNLYKNIAILMNGDSFRSTNKQLEINTCVSMDAQKENADSIKNNLILPLKNNGYYVKVFGCTYLCTNNNDFTKYLSSMYDNAIIKLITRSKHLYGGQMKCMKAVFDLAIMSEENKLHPFSHVIFLRWDYKILTPNINFSLLFDNIKIARNYADMHGLEDWWGKLNADVLLIIENHLFPTFELAVQQGKCCEFREKGPACSYCSRNINFLYYGKFNLYLSLYRYIHNNFISENNLQKPLIIMEKNV